MGDTTKFVATWQRCSIDPRRMQVTHKFGGGGLHSSTGAGASCRVGQFAQRLLLGSTGEELSASKCGPVCSRKQTPADRPAMSQSATTGLMHRNN